MQLNEQEEKSESKLGLPFNSPPFLTAHNGFKAQPLQTNRFTAPVDADPLDCSQRDSSLNVTTVCHLLQPRGPQPGAQRVTGEADGGAPRLKPSHD